jgi:Zn-dependent protease
MRREFALFKIGGLQLSAEPSAFIGWLALWLVLGVVSAVALQWSAETAMIGGALAALLHVASETAHQIGHALAAKRTGWPMIGVRYWGVLGTSVYPADEPDLPGAVHIRRAQGGPIASLSLGIAAAALTWLLSPSAGPAFWLAAFTALDNMLVLGLGAMLPLGFTDGSTILRYGRTH